VRTADRRSPARLITATTAFGLVLAISAAPAGAAPSSLGTIGVGSAPDAIAFNSSFNRAYVSHLGATDVRVIDGATNTVMGSIALSSSSRGLAVDVSSHRLSVSNGGSLTTFDGSSHTMVGNVGLPGIPYAVAPVSSSRVFVALGPANAVGVVNTITNTLQATIGVGVNPQGVAHSVPIQPRVFVSNRGSNTVTVLDSNSFSVVTTIPVGAQPVSVLAVGGTVYVANTGSGSVSVINASTLTVTATITGLSAPSGLAADLSRSRLFVTGGPVPVVDVVDTSTNVKLTSVSVPASPTGIVLDQSRRKLFVSSQSTNSVEVLQLDQVAPSVTIDTAPPALTNDPTATFEFHGADNDDDETLLVYRCRLDFGAFTPCPSPRTMTGLSEGSHVFGVRAVDVDGNMGSEVSRSWTLDLTAPTTSLTASPSDPSRGVVQFEFTGADNLTPTEQLGFRCRLDDAEPEACSSPLDLNVTSGAHTLRIASVDQAGNEDASVAEFSWTADATAPRTFIVDGPASDTITGRSVVFEFVGTDNLTPSDSLEFRCRLDDAAFEPCASPIELAELTGGERTFQVAALDAVGNIDESPASRTWIVEAGPPETTIEQAPADPTNATTATLAFSGLDDVTAADALTFTCSLDGGTTSPCDSPATFAGLDEGIHGFSVAATDAFGNTDPTPATLSWTIDLTPPDTSVASGPASPTNDRSAGFTFGGGDDHSPVDAMTFECRMDDAAFASCASPHAVTNLGAGAHVFEVRSVDEAGNADPSPASYAWTIDAGAPASVFTTGNPGTLFALPGISTPVTGATVDDAAGVASVDVTFTPESVLGTASTGPALLACSNGNRSCTWAAFPPAVPGIYRVTVRSSDQLGNIESPGPSAITVVVIAPPQI
jgi:YVTN family beta-propeller protein